MNTDLYSTGPFCRVFFMLDQGVLGTYTYRHHYLDGASIQLSTLTTLDHNHRFCDVFVNTDSLIGLKGAQPM